MGYDIIVIGAGLAGLTAGAKLAREGRKVLLLEPDRGWIFRSHLRR
jgi:phytoene dehydrogenase-like protein